MQDVNGARDYVISSMVLSGLQYGPLRTPPRRSYEDDDVDAHDASFCGRWRRCCRCRKTASLPAARWFEGWRNSSRTPLPPEMRDTEAGGSSPGLSWRGAVRTDGMCGCGLVLQRGATLISVALFFAAPLCTFFVGKRYFGDVPAGVFAAVLLQGMVIVYAVCSAQSVAGAESTSPRRARKNR